MAHVTVYLTLNPADAQLVRSRLEAANLHPELVHEISALTTEGYALTTGGIALQVPEEEAQDARLAIESKSAD